MMGLTLEPVSFSPVARPGGSGEGRRPSSLAPSSPGRRGFGRGPLGMTVRELRRLKSVFRGSEGGQEGKRRGCAGRFPGGHFLARLDNLIPAGKETGWLPASPGPFPAGVGGDDGLGGPSVGLFGSFGGCGPDCSISSDLDAEFPPELTADPPSRPQHPSQETAKGANAKQPNQRNSQDHHPHQH